MVNPVIWWHSPPSRSYLIGNNPGLYNTSLLLLSLPVLVASTCSPVSPDYKESDPRPSLQLVSLDGNTLRLEPLLPVVRGWRYPPVFLIITWVSRLQVLDPTRLTIPFPSVLRVGFLINLSRLLIPGGSRN